MSASHPLPTPPAQQQQQQQQYYQQYQQQQSYGQQPQAQQYDQYQASQPMRPVQRERAKTGFSVKSGHSRKSSGNKNDLTETHDEKMKKRLTTKADPNMAVSEQEPSAVAQTQPSVLASLRGIQHKDSFGNPIADPDRSNPTRNRWERPLDTIRSFEAAIDGSYARKSTYSRSDAQSVMGGGNRRSSYYASGNGYYNGNNNGRGSMSRPDSYYGNQSQYDQHGNSNRQRWNRTNSEPMHGNNNHYAMNGGGYDAATTASGSGSSGDPLGYQTDPSSENSSFERVPKDSAETYGMNGFGGGPQFQPPGSGIQSQQGQYPQGGPPVPTKAPIALGSSNMNPNPGAPRPPVEEKRKSWFGRRFSKQ